MQLDVTTSSRFGRADSVEGLGPAASLEDAFTTPLDGVLGPLAIQGRNIVAKVTEKSAADLTALPVERDSLLAQLKQKKAQDRNALLMDGILAEADQRRQGGGEPERDPESGRYPAPEVGAPVTMIHFWPISYLTSGGASPTPTA